MIFWLLIISKKYNLWLFQNYYWMGRRRHFGVGFWSSKYFGKHTLQQKRKKFFVVGKLWVKKDFSLGQMAFFERICFTCTTKRRFRRENAFLLDSWFWWVQKMIPFLVYYKQSVSKEARNALFVWPVTLLTKSVCITLSTQFFFLPRNVAFEKRTLKWQWKEDKTICGKAKSYLRRLFGPSWENWEISK